MDVSLQSPMPDRTERPQEGVLPGPMAANNNTLLARANAMGPRTGNTVRQSDVDAFISLLDDAEPTIDAQSVVTAEGAERASAGMPLNRPVMPQTSPDTAEGSLSEMTLALRQQWVGGGASGAAQAGATLAPAQPLAPQRLSAEPIAAENPLSVGVLTAPGLTTSLPSMLPSAQAPGQPAQVSVALGTPAQTPDTASADAPGAGPLAPSPNRLATVSEAPAGPLHEDALPGRASGAQEALATVGANTSASPQTPQPPTDRSNPAPVIRDTPLAPSRHSSLHDDDDTDQATSTISLPSMQRSTQALQQPAQVSVALGTPAQTPDTASADAPGAGPLAPSPNRLATVSEAPAGPLHEDALPGRASGAQEALASVGPNTTATSPQTPQPPTDRSNPAPVIRDTPLAPSRHSSLHDDDDTDQATSVGLNTPSTQVSVAAIEAAAAASMPIPATPAAPAAATTTESRPVSWGAEAITDVVRQVTRTLALRDLDALQAGREIVVHLDAAVLPDTALHFRTDGSEAVVRIQTGSTEVQQFLDGHLDQLRSAMAAEAPGLRWTISPEVPAAATPLPALAPAPDSRESTSGGNGQTSRDSGGSAGGGSGSHAGQQGGSPGGRDPQQGEPHPRESTVASFEAEVVTTQR